jgi:ribonuclease Z
VGGLPGMILTTADVADRAMEQMVAATKVKQRTTQQQLPGLDLIGPKGTKEFIHSLRHFMRRDKFELRIQEGDLEKLTSKEKRPIGRRKETLDEAFMVETIPLQYESGGNRSGSATKRPRTGPIDTQSYVFTTPPVLGTFLPQKAKDLGIPPGPLYGELKSGQSVTFSDKAGIKRTVQSNEVVVKGSSGVAVAVLYYPSLDVLKQIQESKAMQQFLPNETKEGSPTLELIVHMAPKSLFSASQCQDWLLQFGPTVEHLLLESHSTVADLIETTKGAHEATPFRSAALGAFRRSLISPDIFPSPLICKSNNSDSDVFISDQQLTTKEATSLLEYVLIPRGKKGFVDADRPVTIDEREARAEVEGCGAIQLSENVLRNHTSDTSRGELIFTGTGAALPCKHRNVSGIFLRMANGNAMMFDVGESTVGQLLRSTSVDQHPIQTLKSIKAAWISHPHADHHLGLLRLLTERRMVVEDDTDRLILIAPPNLFRFLDEYSNIDHRIQGSYEALDCRAFTEQNDNVRISNLYSKLGITSCVAVPVSHCQHSYAVLVDGTSFGRVAYSGDCRPSKNFAKAALNADLLIHEATFEDGMESEAVLKNHCTVSEALGVARDMKAKAVVLTHFSQRYPKIPPVCTSNNQLEHSGPSLPIVFAFDFMKVAPSNITLASELVPALRLLYPEEAEDADEEKEEDESNHPRPSASEILGTVGLFAHISKMF